MKKKHLLFVGAIIAIIALRVKTNEILENLQNLVFSYAMLNNNRSFLPKGFPGPPRSPILSFIFA
ncbi:MAG: hypothetical protein IJL07_09870, partial [Lachnospiraceae bacterium]|nr:hypothetical protein [Lachnospiraceae bacterium]